MEIQILSCGQKPLRLLHEILEYFENDSATIKSDVMILRCNHAHFINKNKYVLLENTIHIKISVFCVCLYRIVVEYLIPLDSFLFLFERSLWYSKVGSKQKNKKPITWNSILLGHHPSKIYGSSKNMFRTILDLVPS